MESRDTTPDDVYQTIIRGERDMHHTALDMLARELTRLRENAGRLRQERDEARAQRDALADALRSIMMLDQRDMHSDDPYLTAFHRQKWIAARGLSDADVPAVKEAHNGEEGEAE